MFILTNTQLLQPILLLILDEKDEGCMMLLLPTLLTVALSQHYYLVFYFHVVDAAKAPQNPQKYHMHPHKSLPLKTNQNPRNY